MELNRPKLFGLMGTKGSGKDTSVAHLRSNPRIACYALADPLKQVTRDLFQMTEAQMHDPVVKETVDPRWNRSPRELLQWLGTDCIRDQIDPDFWLKRFVLWYDQVVRDGSVDAVFVTDIRFRNEAEMVHRLGGKVVRVVRGERGGDSKDSTDPTHTHVSETQLDTVVPDVVVQNDSTVDTLQQSINDLMAT
jgi:hypothetical protein